MRPFESVLDMFQIVGDGLAVEMVDDQSFATGGSALHLHHPIAHIKSHHLPLGSFEFFQPEFQDLFQGFVVCSLDLRLQYILRRPSEQAVLDVRGDVVGMSLPISHHLAQLAVRLVFGRRLQRQIGHTRA